MRCEEVQEYLAERLAGSLSDRLSGTVHTYVRTHMLSCPECCEELEDFKEMQAVLRAIPIEPCDSEAMRSRFDLLMGAKEVKIERQRIPAVRSWTLNRSIKILLAATVATAVLATAVLAWRHGRIGQSDPIIAPQVPSSAPRPAAAPLQTVPAEVPREVPIATSVQPAPAPDSSQMAEIRGTTLTEDRSEVSGTQLVTVEITVRDENGDRLPFKPDTSIVFTGTSSAFRVSASCVVGNLFRAAVPANETLIVLVNNVASGYSVQSVVDANMTDLMHGGLFMVGPRVSSPSRIVVTLKKN